MDFKERKERLCQYLGDADIAITVNSDCDCRFIESINGSDRFTQCSYHGVMPELLEKFQSIIRSLFKEFGYSEQLFLARTLLDEMEERKKESNIA